MNKKIILLLAVVFFSPCVFGFSQDLKIEISDNGTAEITHLIRVENETKIEVILICENPENLNVSSGNENIDFEIENGKVIIEDITTTDGFSVTYLSNSLTNKQQGEWSVAISNARLSSSSIEIRLPSNTKITLFEPDATIYFEEPSMVVFWANENLENSNVKLKYSFLINTTNETNFTPYMITFVLIVIIAVSFFFLKNKLRKIVKNGFSKEQENLLKTLSEKESTLVKLVSEDDELTQKKLLLKSGIPKATLSRTLKGLEEKNFIRIVQDGYSNKVFLSDWFKEK